LEDYLDYEISRYKELILEFNPENKKENLA